MKDIFVLLNNNIKGLMKRTQFWLALIFLGELLIAWLIIYVYLENGDDRYHFYMNTKRSLEEIHGVKLDKYDGSIARDLSTEEQLIRKSHERWHLRKVFK